MNGAEEELAASCIILLACLLKILKIFEMHVLDGALEVEGAGGGACALQAPHR